ncbi:MAG: competence/damage-inducible protein A [Saprospiraceae bacterium]|nr:competence/damage-inducible protein A [Saprospiraceae bacterium]
MVAAIIVIGDELLLGQVIDTNSAFIAQRLSELGIKVVRKWTIADTLEEINQALKEASQLSELVFLTGGLGPTKDDITKKAISDFFKVPLQFSEKNYEHLHQFLTYRKIPIRDSHKVQCYIPSNAELLENKLGTAMGMWIEHNNKIFISMPGVPDEMKYILLNGALPRIQKLWKGHFVSSKTFHTCGVGETEIAERLEPVLLEFMDRITIAYLPSIAQVRFRITTVGQDQNEMNELLDQCSIVIRKEFGQLIFGEDKTLLEIELGKLLKENKLTIGTVESCTGGTIASKLSSVPGCSDYYKGSIISYATEIKETLLGIPDELIQEHNVVSSQVAEAMVRNSVGLLKSDLIISSTGIAGPDGGTEKIPLGTVFISCGNSKRILTRKLTLGKNRDRNIEAASVLALNLAREWVLGIEI